MTIPTENADFLVGDDNFNFIDGLGGNDLIFGKGADDLLLGGEGDDLLSGGRGDDTLNGGNGSDTVNYNDDIFAITADLFTGKMTLTANGIAEIDTLLSIENITGGGGGDKIFGNDAANTLQGMAGDDEIVGHGGVDKLFGGAGSDRLTGGTGADQLNGGSGYDYAIYSDSAAGVTVNLLTGISSGGSAQGDTLVDIEVISGSAFADTLTAGATGASLIGGSGKDKITGGSAGDVLSGGDGNDTLNGLAGADIFYSGNGSDTLDGGEGFDSLRYDNSDTGVQVDFGKNTATGGEAEGDIISNIENLYGSEFADILSGDALGNGIFGHGGDDTLRGRGGDDHLFGGAGQDTVTGGTGNDTLFYTTLSESGTSDLTRDLITDFTSGADKISLQDIDADSALSGNQAFKFVGTAGFSGAHGELHAFFSNTSTILEGDVNGDKKADFQIEFVGHLTFADGDFIL